MAKETNLKPNQEYSFSLLLNKAVNLLVAHKIIAYFLLSMLVGSGFVGFAAEFATYTYAYFSGMRLPLEGIPYLQTTVTLATLAFPAILFALYWVLSAIFALLSNTLGYSDPKKKFYILQIIVFSTFKYLTALAIILWFATFFFETDSGTYTLIVFITVIVYSFLPRIAKEFHSILARVICALIYLAMAFSLFIPSLYEKIIQITGYGGRVNVKITTTLNPDNETNCLLSLRTSEVLICENHKIDNMTEFADRPRYTEYPIISIVEISYDKHFSTSTWALNKLQKKNLSPQKAKEQTKEPKSPPISQ